jgi:hypothetical protein
MLTSCSFELFSNHMQGTINIIGGVVSDELISPLVSKLSYSQSWGSQNKPRTLSLGTLGATDQRMLQRPQHRYLFSTGLSFPSSTHWLAASQIRADFID